MPVYGERNSAPRLTIQLHRDKDQPRLQAPGDQQDSATNWSDLDWLDEGLAEYNCAEWLQRQRYSRQNLERYSRHKPKNTG